MAKALGVSPSISNRELKERAGRRQVGKGGVAHLK